LPSKFQSFKQIYSRFIYLFIYLLFAGRLEAHETKNTHYLISQTAAIA